MVVAKAIAINLLKWLLFHVLLRLERSHCPQNPSRWVAGARYQGIYVWKDGYLFLVFFFAVGFGFFWRGSWFHAFCFFASLLFAFPASLLVYFSASLLFCFLLFLLFVFPASLLYLLLFFSASLLSLLPCFSAFVLFLLYFVLFFSHVLCCSTSCSSASLLPVFTTSLFFLFCCLLCILNKTLKTQGETKKNLKEILIRTPDKKPLHETLNEP